jgi:hypothetical protein
VVRTRLGGEALTPKGDLVAEELEEVETLRPSVDSRSRSFAVTLNIEVDHHGCERLRLRQGAAIDNGAD